MTSSLPLLSVYTLPYRLVFREEVGIAHEEQVIEVPIPDGSPALFFLRDGVTGRLFPVQASRREAGRGYLRLALGEGECLSLEATEAVEEIGAAVSIAGWTAGNGRWEIEFSGGEAGPREAGSFAPGPVARVRQGAGAWRGRTFFDTAQPLVAARAEWLEAGPLRAVCRYRAEFGGGGVYELTATADAPSDFLRFDEQFHGGAADQLVWDFSGADLPERLSLLDSTAGATVKEIHFHYDLRHARLWAWNQFSQLHDLSDGFALHFPQGDALGWVTLEGGSWNGNALNHLEAWSRRWEADDGATRRLPFDVKADSFPGPERIPARGESVCAPHFSVEGWLRRGRRSFALVPSTGAALAPGREGASTLGVEGCSVALGHFEEVPDRAAYRAQQGRLRRIHTQYGLLPLQAQLGMTFAWPVEEGFSSGGEHEGRRRALALAQLHQPPAPEGDPERLRQLDDYLAARVHGFWEGSGSAYSNCVVGRKIGPEMFRLEDLARRGLVDGATLARWRARFAFLSYLNASENYYIGPATMAPMGALETTEPTLAGMANQNFYTDVIAVFGFAAQAFPLHPEAAGWRERFIGQWAQQLRYHLYPKSGLWEESHTYYQHVLHTLLPLLLRRREDGAGDFFADPAMQRMVAAALVQVTPRHAEAGGRRHLLALGDHGAERGHYRHVYAEYARALLPHAPGLARQLAWLAVENGAAPASVEAIGTEAPPWGNGPVEGLGYFFRGRDAAGVETLLALRSGTAWAHHHNDEGSLQFFAKGHALLVDSAFGRPQERGERKVAAAGHSRPVAQGVDPLHFLWRCNRGWIVETAAAAAPFPYAVAGIPLHMTWPSNLGPQPVLRSLWELRAVIELAPDTYLVADYLDARQPHVLRFHVALPEVGTDEEGGVRALFGDGVELRLIPLLPVAPPQCSGDRSRDPKVGVEEATTSVDYVGVTGPWSLFLVAARAAGEPPPEIEILSEGRETRIGKAVVAWTEDRLTVRSLSAGEGAPVVLDPSRLLAPLKRP